MIVGPRLIPRVNFRWRLRYTSAPDCRVIERWPSGVWSRPRSSTQAKVSGPVRIAARARAEQLGQFAVDVAVVVVDQQALRVEHAESLIDVTGGDCGDPDADIGWRVVHVVPGQVPDLEEGCAGDRAGVD